MVGKEDDTVMLIAHLRCWEVDPVRSVLSVRALFCDAQSQRLIL